MRKDLASEQLRVNRCSTVGARGSESFAGAGKEESSRAKAQAAGMRDLGYGQLPSSTICFMCEEKPVEVRVLLLLVLVTRQHLSLVERRPRPKQPNLSPSSPSSSSSSSSSSSRFLPSGFSPPPSAQLPVSSRHEWF